MSWSRRWSGGIRIRITWETRFGPSSTWGEVGLLGGSERTWELVESEL